MCLSDAVGNITHYNSSLNSSGRAGNSEPLGCIQPSWLNLKKVIFLNLWWQTLCILTGQEHLNLSLQCDSGPIAFEVFGITPMEHRSTGLCPIQRDILNRNVFGNCRYLKAWDTQARQMVCVHVICFSTMQRSLHLCSLQICVLFHKSGNLSSLWQIRMKNTLFHIKQRFSGQLSI